MSYRWRIGALELRLTRRQQLTRKISVLVSILAVLLAVLATAVLFWALGKDPLQAYSVIVHVFVDPRLLGESLARGVPIALTALGLIVAFKMNFWNIGGEGQIYMGMFAATGIVIWNAATHILPPEMVLVTMFVAAFAAGSLWGLIPAFLKAKLQVNEVLTTLMMNYIAILFVDYLVYGPWKDPHGHGFPLSIPFPDYALLPKIPGTMVTSGVLLSVLAAAAVHYILTNTKLGYEIRVVGESSSAAKYAGISFLWVAMLGMLISAGLAGVGGLTIVSGIIGRLRPRASPGYGYTAIIVAFLAGLNPWVAVPVGLIFGGLVTAGEALQAALRIPFSGIQVFQALIFLFVIVGEFLKRYSLSFRVVRG